MSTKQQKNNKPKKQLNFKPVIGLLELMVIASIGFMSFIVITGLEGHISKALTVPALVWCAVKLFVRFAK